MDFHSFALKVNQKFNRMAGAENGEVHGGLYEVGDADAIWEQYLAAFPEGTNPVYKERTEHDCSCCRNFVKNIGRAVFLDSHGNRHTVWDVSDLVTPYKEVAQVLDSWLKVQPINSLWATVETSFGSESTVQQLEDKSVKRWHHFWGTVPRFSRSKTPDAVRGTFNGKRELLARSFEKLTPEALRTVLQLIEDNALYRGAEHKSTVTAFLGAQHSYNTKPEDRKEEELCLLANTNVAFFKNSVIGTLVEDLSEGMDEEKAVARFEAKVAPANYQRPKAVVTKKMVDEAIKTLTTLGFADSIERRFAKESDVPVSALLWTGSNTSQKIVQSNLQRLLLDSAISKPTKANADSNCTFDQFGEHWLPNCTSIELQLENRMVPQLFSLTAAQHADAPGMFKWGNTVAWTYNGDMTDAVAERVKAAGGATDVPLRVSLAWANPDDLDLHCSVGSKHISYGDKTYAGRQVLDVDMNAWGPKSDTAPVENMAFEKPPNGVYKFQVHQFSRRSTARLGYEVHIVTKGRHIVLSSADNSTKEFSIEYQDGEVVKVKDVSPGLQSESSSIDVWGMKTNTFIPVKAIIKSPNFWDTADGVGNLHWFFQLDGCKNPEEARGFYNEFLNSDLLAHKRVLELAGGKSRCLPSTEQVSGVGFSSTRPNTATLRVTTDKGVRPINVSF